MITSRNVSNAPCDIRLWQSSGYPNKTYVMRKFAILCKIVYSMGNNRIILFDEFNKINKYGYLYLWEFSNADCMTIHDLECDKIILVIRGTDIKNVTNNRNRDMRTNIFIIYGYPTESQRFKEMNIMLRKLISRYGMSKLILTGHSMGGKMAFELSKKWSIPSISFNQFSSPRDRSSNYMGVHFNTNLSIKNYDILSISSSKFDNQKNIPITAKSDNTHTIDNFI